MADPARHPRAAPVVLLGVASTALTAVAADQRWMSLSPAETSSVPLPPSALDQAPQVPLAFTLALVALAAWGVVLVTRRAVRRGVAVLGLVSALGALSATVAGWWQLRESLRAGAEAAGVDADLAVSPWYVVALALAALAVVPALVAVVRVGSWPEMGRRYDAPGDAAPAAGQQPVENLDLWKSIDQGRDPTA